MKSLLKMSKGITTMQEKLDYYNIDKLFKSLQQFFIIFAYDNKKEILLSYSRDNTSERQDHRLSSTALQSEYPDQKQCNRNQTL